MKLTSSGLKLFIQKAVKEELDRVLPKMIAERVSELYMRNIISEIAGGNKVREPERTSVVSESRNREIISTLVSKHKLLEDDNPFADIYEGISPNAMDEAPIDDVDISNFSFSSPLQKKIAGIL